jgi:hypothetical protein
VASKTVYYYHFLLQKFWGCWDSGTFMIYQALFSFLLTFSRVFSTMFKDQLRALFRSRTFEEMDGTLKTPFLLKIYEKVQSNMSSILNSLNL